MLPTTAVYTRDAMAAGWDCNSEVPGAALSTCGSRKAKYTILVVSVRNQFVVPRFPGKRYNRRGCEDAGLRSNTPVRPLRLAESGLHIQEAETCLLAVAMRCTGSASQP